MKKFIERLAIGFAQGIGVGVAIILVLWFIEYRDTTSNTTERDEVPFEDVVLTVTETEHEEYGYVGQLVAISLSIENKEESEIQEVFFEFEFFDDKGNFLFEEKEFRHKTIKEGKKDNFSVEFKVPNRIERGIIADCKIQAEATKI